MSTPLPSLSTEPQAYEPPISLWSLVMQYAPRHEQDEMKSILGESLVEQSLELHQEVETFLEIWREYHTNSSDVLKKSKLPEPPDARDRLKQEICFLVRSIQEKAMESGRSSKPILSRHNTDILDYALEKTGLGTNSRPSTACSQHDGRETPVMMTASNSDRLSLASTLSDDVESMKEKLDMLHLEEVAQHLRDTLEEEVSLLLSDISFLQNCLDEEADFRCGSRMAREPTLTELREERAKLEKDLLSSEPVIASTFVEPSVRRLSQGLKPSSSKLRPPSASPGSAALAPVTSARPAPLKPPHPFSTTVFNLPFPDSNCGANDHNVNSVHKLSDSQRRARQELRMDQSDLGYLCKEQASHVQIRTADLPAVTKGSARVVRVGRIAKPAEGAVSTKETMQLKPSPPSSAKPTGVQRPGSASRFRRMVLHCRDAT